MIFYYAALIIGIVLIFVLVCPCSKKTTRKVPLNYILLFSFTAVWSYMVASFVIHFSPESVLTCAAMVLVMFVALTLYAIFAKVDLNICFAVAFVLILAIFPLILFCWFFPSKILYNFLYVLIIVLTCIYIVIDTKAIFEQLSPDEYIIGALMLYVDII